MASRLFSFVVWAFVAAGAAFWGLRVFVNRPGLPPQAQLPAVHLATQGDLSRLLGASPAADDEEEAAPASDRFKLVGVVAPRGSGGLGQGVALIAVGDAPPKAWRTGATVDGDTVMLGVGTRSAQLGPRGGPPTVALELPPPSSANRGTMPLPAAGGINPGVPPGMPLRPGFGPNGAMVPQPGSPQAAQNGQAPHAPAQPAANSDDEDSDNE